MKRILLGLLLGSLFGCSEHSKMEDYRVSHNRRITMGMIGPDLDNSTSLDDWMKGFSRYCETEGYSDEECKEKVKEFRDAKHKEWDKK
jgi:hypothetical protein